MRIAIFHELNEGGARKAVIELATRLNRRNIVDLYYVDSKRDKKEEKIFTKSYYFPFKNIEWKGYNWKKKLNKDSFELLKLFFLHKRIAKKIDENNYDLVFAHPSKFTQAPFLLRHSKTPVFYYAEESLRVVYEPLFAIDNKLNIFKKKYEEINRFFRKLIDISNIKKAKYILTNSDFTKNNLKRNYNLDSIVCYLGVDDKLFKPKNIYKTTDILFFGTQTEEDGYIIFRIAIEKMKNKNLVIRQVGDRKTWITENNWLLNTKKQSSW